MSNKTKQSKVIKMPVAPQSGAQVIDKIKVAQLTEKFNALVDESEKKQYPVVLDEDTTKYLLNVFFNEIEWKGFESFAISKSYDRISEAVKKNILNAELEPEIIEAIFHFVKSYQGKGVKNTNAHILLANGFAVAINELNKDRQELKDVALEIQAAELGISVEQLVRSEENK